MNAVRHGLTGKASVLPGEDWEALDDLTTEMVADLRPRGAMERELVGRIIGFAWRLRRIAKIEEIMWFEQRDDDIRSYENAVSIRPMFGNSPGVMEPELRPALPADQFITRQFASQGVSALERIAVYEQRLDRALHAALRQLQQLRKNRAEDEEDKEDATKAPDPTPSPPTIPIPQNEPTASATRPQDADEQPRSPKPNPHRKKGITDAELPDRAENRDDKTKPRDADSIISVSNDPVAVPNADSVVISKLAASRPSKPIVRFKHPHDRNHAGGVHTTGTEPIGPPVSASADSHDVRTHRMSPDSTT